ncbi:Arsenic efflux pump protein [Enhygromyxa salina]|uniref:Arsenic efflux pump protein n=1 Tax=Enhygromyxa salina TaxID=215803 RepID=A0A0C2D417_9BACT|nr:SLC13 family permease [Enhygromyxa salina]KIG14842.1 Arsenic efflux pump protein [Enhygromyxa salina]
MPPLSLLLASTAPTSEAHEVPMSITLVFTALLLGMILCLAFEEKIHAKKSLIAGVFAVVCLLVGTAVHILPFGPVIVGGHEIDMPIYIPAIDWGVIAIILGSSLFIDVTSKSGLFTWIAIKLTKASKGEPRRLLWLYGLMTVVFSAVLNNVTAMLIVGSLTGVSLKKLGREQYLLGFLLVEGLLTNIGGLLTLISSVPNIIVGTAAGISFVEFFYKASPYVIVATIVTIAMGVRLFKIEALPDDAAREQAAAQVQSFDENDGIESQGFFWFGTGMTVLFVLVIATTSVLPWVSDLGMGFVALGFAVIMLLRYKSSVDQFYKGLDWDLLGFFAALFVVINVMEHAQVLALIGTGLAWMIGLGETAGTALVLVSASAFSSVTDNIPLAAMLSKILGNMGTPSTDPKWWSVVFGANLGGNLTPIGSASTLVAVTIIHRYKLELSFAGFVVKALPYALIQIALAVGYVLLVLA